MLAVRSKSPSVICFWMIVQTMKSSVNPRPAKNAPKLPKIAIKTAAAFRKPGLHGHKASKPKTNPNPLQAAAKPC